MKLKPNQPIALVAVIDSGVFSGERSCVVTLANGESYREVVPAHFCWDLEGNPLTEQPTEPVSGLVAVRFIEFAESPERVYYDQLIVSIMNVLGETQTIAVDKSIARPRPLCPVLNKDD